MKAKRELRSSASSITKEINISAEELLSFAYQQPDKIPPGFKSQSHWCQFFNRSQSRTREILTSLVENKKMERKEFQVRNAKGRVSPAPHWRVIAR